MGGSFGSKHFMAKQIALAGSMAKLTGRPVKFMEDRADNLLANDAQAPDRRTSPSWRSTPTASSSRCAPTSSTTTAPTSCSPSRATPTRWRRRTGPYTIGTCETAVKAVLTNKNQQGVFRGAGSEVTNWVLERLVDAAAAELGIDAIELRRRNLIQPDQFPYKIPTGNFYDSGDYPAVLDKALAHADLDCWRAEQERGARGGPLHRHRRRAGPAALDLRLDRVLVPQPRAVRRHVDHAGERADAVGPTGGVTATMFSPFWGNSPETVAAQLIADELGVDPADVAIAYDSTAHGLP